MAIEVRIPKEITEYREKIMFGMSVRQLVCFSTAIALSVGVYFLCTAVLGLSMDAASYAVMLIAMPLMAVGFINKNGFTFEKYAALCIRHRIGQQVRPYSTELLVDKIKTGEEMQKAGGKYDWIFEKTENGDGEKIAERGRKSDAARRECEVFACTKAGRKKKRKAALRTIKAARKEYRALERGTAKKV